MKQSAVEFAVEKLEKFIPSGNQLVIRIILDQAKEMFKNQNEDAYLQGFAECDAKEIMDFEKYYKQTYKE